MPYRVYRRYKRRRGYRTKPYRRGYRSFRRWKRSFRSSRIRRGAVGPASRRWSSIKRLFPNKLRLKLQYVDSTELAYVMNTGSAYEASYVYRGNSIYDPDLTGTGHQPYGTDELYTWYSNYTVFSVKCTFVGRVIRATGGGLRAMMYCSNSSTNEDFEDLWEDQRNNLVARKMLVPVKTYEDQRFKISKFFRFSDLYNANYMSETAFTTNPGSVMYIHIHFKSVNSADCNVYGTMRMQMYTQLEIRKSPAQS